MGTLSQLDHILINKKWSNSIRNCRAFNTIELDSDHRPISISIKVSLRSVRLKPCNRVRYNWNRLQDPLIKHEYQLKLSNRFALLEDQASDTPISERYNNFEQTVHSVAQEVIGIRKSTGLPSWVSVSTEAIRAERDIAKQTYMFKKDLANKQKWRNLADKLKIAYEQDHLNALNSKLKVLTEAQNLGHINQTWDIINELAGKKPTRSAPVKLLDGSAPKNKQDSLNDWKTYFMQLLNRIPGTSNIFPPPASEDLPIETSPPSLEETKSAINNLKRNKAAAMDTAFTPEALKDGGKDMAAFIHDFLH